MFLGAPLLCRGGGVGDIIGCEVDLGEDTPGIIRPGEFGCGGYGLLDQECFGD